jgi:hypothetical protein
MAWQSSLSHQAAAVQELLSHGVTPTEVSVHLGLPLPHVSAIKREMSARERIETAEIDRVSPKFAFDGDYHNAVIFCFGGDWGCQTAARPISPEKEVFDSFMSCQSPSAFVHGLYAAIDGFISSGLRWDITRFNLFFGGLFSLPHGTTWALSISAMLLLVWRETGKRLTGRHREIRATADLVHSLCPAVAPNLNDIPAYAPTLAISEPSLTVDFERSNAASFPPASEFSPDALLNRQAALARARRQTQIAEAHDQGSRLTTARLRLATTSKKGTASGFAPPVAVTKSLHRSIADIIVSRVDRDLHGVLVDRTLLRMSMVVCSYSQTAYEFLRRYFPLPSRGTLYRNYVDRISDEERNLTDTSKLSSIMRKHEHFAYATIAVDAVSLDNVFLSDRVEDSLEDQPSHAFVYECLPLTTSGRCFPVHVMPAQSGNAASNHIERAREIVAALAGLRASVRVLFIATDGDRGYEATYRCQFNHWFPHYRAHGLKSCLDFVRTLFPLYVGDILHLIKNIRSRILEYILVLRYHRHCIEVRWEAMSHVLKLGEVFSDRSTTGKMRDAYPIALFRLSHVIKLFVEGRYGEAVYLLPWALVMTSIGSNRITKDSRVLLLELSLRFFMHLYIDVSENGHYLGETGPEGTQVVPYRSICLMRSMSTIIGILSALRLVPDDIPLDRISTHPLENFFGLLRRLLHDCNSYDELLHGAARNAIVNEIYQELGHPRDICGRENAAGIVSTEGQVELPLLPCDMDDALEQIFRTLLMPQSSDPTLTSQELDAMTPVMTWLESVQELSSTPYLERRAHFTIRGTANSKIMASILQRRNHARSM